MTPDRSKIDPNNKDNNKYYNKYDSTSDNRSDCKQYYYDSFGQLIRENNKGLDKTFVYEYDSIGNIVKVKTYDYTTDETLSGNYTSKTYSYTSAIKDALTKVDTTNITYDNFGRPVTYGDWTFVWTNGRLARMCDDIDDTSWYSSEDIRFNYNGYGQRISKSYSYDSGDDSSGDYITGTSNAYDYDSLGRLIHERFTTYHNESATVHRDLVYLYDESGIIGVLYTLGGTTTGYYYRRNLQGDVVGIYDKYGTRMAEYAYDAFGNCSLIYQSSGTDIGEVNPIRYRSYYYDHETGMYYIGSRYYNPQWRRFISPSLSSINPGAVNGLNGYAYANNNPFNFALDNADAEEKSNVKSAKYNLSVSNAIHSGIVNLNSWLSLPEIPWLVENATTIYGTASSLLSGIPILGHYLKYASIINDEFRLYGISKWKTSLQLSDVSFKMGALDGLLLGVNVLIDMYDSYQRGVGIEGILLGGALTAASGILMFYLNKGIMWTATTIGTAICPGIGTAVGFSIGLGISLFVDWKVGELISNWIDLSAS